MVANASAIHALYRELYGDHPKEAGIANWIQTKVTECMDRPNEQFESSIRFSL